jgi:hypothetical protein
MTELETQMYVALKALPCRCQMAGREKWHLRAQMTVDIQCSRCKAIEAYEKQQLLT